MRIRFVIGFLIALVAIASSRGETPLTTAFTYQGQLKQNGIPVDGPVNMVINLWDAATDGNPIGPIVDPAPVQVTNGLFTVQLDYGNVFNGDARWLQIAVSNPAGGGGLTTLSPRQPLTAAPHALFALNAATADTATNATQLNGQPEAFYANASNILTGTLANARLSANVALQSAANTFTGTNTFNAPVTVNAALTANSLTIDPVSRTLSIAPHEFNGWGLTVEPGSNLEQVYNPSSTISNQAFAAVHLPDGATVTSLIAHIADENTPDDMSIFLLRRRNDDFAGAVMASIVTSGNVPGFRTFTDSSISSPIIDNDSFFYVVRIDSPGGTAPLALRSVGITYTITKPLP